MARRARADADMRALLRGTPVAPPSVMTTVAISASPAHRTAAARRRARRALVAAALTVPIIYSLALPLVALDLWVSAYQAICFPVYGIARVTRRRYFVIDRHRLPYLSAVEKLHCTYCSYAQGVIGYTREIAARTEAYWCPIKQGRRAASVHRLYPEFFAFGDGPAYRRGLAAERRRLGPARPQRRQS
jgi:hypothetical protein